MEDPRTCEPGVGRGGHGMGRFLAIYNLVKNQKNQNPVTVVIFKFQSTCH